MNAEQIPVPDEKPYVPPEELQVPQGMQIVSIDISSEFGPIVAQLHGLSIKTSKLIYHSA